MAGKDDVDAEVEASEGGSRFGVANASEGAGRLPDGGCWMVWRECPPSMEGRLGCPSKSYSSLTISPELDPEPVRVSPDKSVAKVWNKLLTNSKLSHQQVGRTKLTKRTIKQAHTFVTNVTLISRKASHFS